MDATAATFRQLQVFVTVARRLSFARAAEEFGLTPAAISFQIRQLEESSGSPLFERIGKRIRLTEAGRLLLVFAERALQAMHDADRALAALRDPGSGEIVLGMDDAAIHVAPHLRARFRARHPAANIRLIDGAPAEVLAKLENGDIDFAILGQAPEGSEIETHGFAPQPHVVVAAPSHPLAQQRRRFAFSELGEEHFVLREEGAESRRLLQGLFDAARIAPRIALVAHSNEAAKQAAMANVGLAALSRQTARVELGSRALVALRVTGSPWMSRWFIANRRSLPLLPLHEQFKAFVRSDGGRVIAALESSHTRLRGD